MSGFTVATTKDAPDVLGDYPGEMRLLTGPTEAEQTAFTFRRMPQHTGGKGSYGHYHRTQEEIYFVMSGRLQFKLGDTVVDVEQGGIVRVAPATVRSVWNDEPEDAELIIVSPRIENARDDAVTVPDFWPA
jgi:mannose-6-phosphate isomerase-like protein (cupin superfamily)